MFHHHLLLLLLATSAAAAGASLAVEFRTLALEVQHATLDRALKTAEYLAAELRALGLDAARQGYMCTERLRVPMHVATHWNAGVRDAIEADDSGLRAHLTASWQAAPSERKWTVHVCWGNALDV
jgi:hypothetical protein